MNFDAILKYQEIDRKLYDLEREMYASPENENVTKLKAAVKDAGGGLIRLDADTDEVFKGFEKCQAEIAKIETQINDMSQITLGAPDMSELEYYEKKINELTDKVDQLKKELDKEEYLLDKLIAESEKGIKQFVALKNSLAQANARFSSLLDSKKSQVIAIKTELAALLPDIDKNLLNAYIVRRNNKKLPAIVEYNAVTKSCRCGMELPSNTLDKLKQNGDYAECPNCGRILIVK